MMPLMEKHMTAKQTACGCGSDHTAGDIQTTHAGAYLGAMLVGAMIMVNIFGGEIMRLLKDTENMVSGQTRITEQHTRMIHVRSDILDRAIKAEKDMSHMPHPAPAPKPQ